MAKRERQQPAGGVLGLLEESLGAVRCSRTGTLGCYYIGTLPFILVLLYFLTDVTQSAFAAETLTQGAAAVAVAFIWMKCWQAVYTGRIMAQLCQQTPEPWTGRRILRLAVRQAAIQPLGLIVIPLAAMVMFPLPWAYAFFQNACVYGNERADNQGEKPLASAWAQARVWPGQNISAMLVLMLFGIFVLINVAQAITLPPQLAKMFLDIETPFSRGGFFGWNTTLIAIVLSLQYLCLDPLIKAFYTLRCFYGQSIRTGQDLRSELRALIAAGCLVICCMTLLASPQTASAQDAEPIAAEQAGSGISPGDLDRSLDDVLSQRKYTWRVDPPAELGEDQVGDSFASSVVETLWDWLKYVGKGASDTVDAIWDFLFPNSDGADSSEPGSGSGSGPYAGAGGESAWVVLLRYAVFAAFGVIAIVLCVALWRKYKLIQTREANAPDADALPIDLEDENVTADDLPESGWLDMARKLAEQGDSRLALRAMYLASLAMLADNGRISIARFKSNMDYRRELARRSHAMPVLLDVFGRNVRAFEAVWYGTRQATEEIISTFINNQQTIGQMIENA
jgi:hypothetical protein